MLRVLLLLALCLPASLALAEAAGVDSRQEFPPLGCGNAATGEEAGCHFTNADPALIVSIDGPPMVAFPGGAEIYTASIPVQAEPLLGSGINVAIDSPNAPGCILEEWAPVDKMIEMNDSLDPTDFVLSHAGNNEPPDNLVGLWSYQFLIGNCANPGPLLLRVAMNAFDGNGAEDGEVWNFATLAVTVPEPGATSLAGAVVAALATLSLAREWSSVHRPKSKRPFPP